MAKPTTVKEAIKKFEEASGVNASEAEKANGSCSTYTHLIHTEASQSKLGLQNHLQLATLGLCSCGIGERTACLKHPVVVDKAANVALVGIYIKQETSRVLVELWGQVPPIEKMDATLSTLKACQHVCLSTNNIEKISSLSGMDNLKVLSLGRNQIKKIENLDGVADTLEELWISYNVLEKLVGVEKLTNLRVLYASNNKIKEWVEVERLGVLENLEELLLVGNQLYNDNVSAGTLADYRIEVLKRLPNLKKLDGIPVDVDEKEAAEAARAAG